MCFATVTKRIKHDHWVVSQGLRYESGRGFGAGPVVYSGKGCAEVAKVAYQCSQNIHQLDPIPKGVGSVSEVYKEFGYKSGNSVETHANSLRIWERDAGKSWYGMVQPRGNNLSIVVQVSIYVISPQESYFINDAWKRIEKTILLSEKYGEI